MIVDAHQHVWRLDDPGREWPTPDLTAIHRDFKAGELRPLLAEHGVAATVLVQSMACEGDTERMLALAARTPWIAGVVGWTDLKAADAPARIARLARDPKLRGLRPMLQALPEDDWIADEALKPAVEAMIAHRLCFDALVLPRHLPALFTFARKHLALPVVIDHAAKPEIAGGQLDPWRADLARLAALPNVHCKLSGLVTEAAPDWRIEQLQPYVAHVLECFGPERVLWGSDWPVLNLAADYGRWLQASRALLGHLDDGQRAAIFGANAARFYRLNIF